jgi:pimeloyl-ACP methyl ester carboxylesterase
VDQNNNKPIEKQHKAFRILPIIVNSLVCGIIGAVIGSFWNFWPWLLGSLAFGAGIAVLNERFFSRFKGRIRLYRMRLVILVLLEMLLTIYLLMPLIQAYINTHPGRSPVVGTPADLGLNYEDVTLTTEDGVTLKGWYILGKNRAAVIALHGFGGNRLQVMPQTLELAKAGYGVLAIDLRAQGESSYAPFCGGWNGELDIRPAVDYLQKRAEIDPQKIGGIGYSVGGNVMMHAAAGIPDLRAVIIDGVDAGRTEDYFDPMPPEFQPAFFMTPVPWLTDRFIELFSGVRAAPPLKEEVTRIAPRPILFISSGVGVEQFQTRKFYDRAGATAELWELPDAGHCAGFSVYPQEYTRRMLAFFDRYLLEK